MVYVQFQYLYKKRNIFIEGQVDKTTFHYITLLQKVTQRLYLNHIIDSLTKIFRYQNQQLGSVLIVLFTILITQTIAHFFFNNGQQQGYSHLVLIALSLYAFLIQILIYKHYKIYFLILSQLLFSIALTIVIKYQFNDYHIISYFFALNTVCLLIAISKKLMEEDLQNKIFAIFQFQSNLIIGIYLIIKFIHFYLPYLNNSPLNSFNLIPIIICMTSINSIKIWNLFDFNPVYLIGFLISVQQQEMKQLQKLSLFDQILLMGHQLANKAGKNLMNTLAVQKQYDGTGPQKSVNLDKKTSLPSNVLDDNDQIVQSVNQMLSHQSSEEGFQAYKIQPYSNLIWIPFILNFVFAIALIMLILLRKYSDQSLYLMSMGIFKIAIVMLYCESQSIMMAQTQKHGFYYFLSLLSDFWMVGHLILMYWFYDCFNYNSEYCNFSLAVHAFVPIATRILYRSLSQEAVQNQTNEGLAYFFVCWIFILGVRQTIEIIFPLSNFSYVYIIIDTFLLFYFTVTFLTIGKVQFYRWIIQQFEKMRKMRKYKLYLMENLRNWRFDITELNQLLFLINQIIFFLGYNKFMRLNLENSSAYKTQYFVICGSAIVAHLLHCYNNFFTQTQLEQYQKPKYSPYFNYVIMVVGSGTYVLVAFFGKFEANRDLVQSHKYYSLLTAGLCIFLIFTNVFSHYSYETVQQFKHASKPINLIISYFIFYYPFITVFTVFFFTNDLDTSYIFRFAIAGFAYLTIASVTMGILVHAILNLTEKSKRTLFAIKALTVQFRKINLKEDGLFISMLQNLYDLMDGDSDKLLAELKTQKIAKIIFHDDLNVEYDYSIVEPDKKQNQYVKVFADIVDKNQERPNKSRKLILHTMKSLSKKQIQTKMDFFKKESLEMQAKNKAMLIHIRKNKIENKNLTEIKRLIEAIEGVKLDRDSKLKRSVETSQDFREILKSKEKVAQNMNRFFHFLSDPEESFDFQMFKLLNSLLNVNNKDDLQYEFNKYSLNGLSISQQGFRDFIVDFVRNQQKNQGQIVQSQQASKLWSRFMQSHLFLFILKGNDIFKYYMKRKNVQLSSESRKIWESTTNQQKAQQMIDFRQKYNMRKQKALGKKGRNSIITIGKKIGQEEQGVTQIKLDTVVFQRQQARQQSLEQGNPQAVQQKKHILFLSSQQIYTMLVQKLVETLRDYEKIEHQNFKLEQFNLGLSNIISILTKLFDFTYLYMYGSIYAMWAYGNEDFSNNKYILSFVNYDIVFGVALAGVVAYIGLIMFHKKQFTNGSLGVDQNQRAISFTNLKFYTTFLLFLMGSSFANVFIMTSLNSYICEEQSHYLWNFPDNQCYTTTHMIEMFGSLLMLLAYYPLASLIFPFSSAIDQTLQIKYKAEFQIVYLQSKFLVNGMNVIFNQLNFQTQELIKSSSKTFVCIVLAILFHKLRPCSVEFINKIQLKIYIALAIINGAGILCYFLELYITLIISLVILLSYFIYLLCTSVKISNSQLKVSKNDASALVNDRFKKQEIFKIRLQQCNDNELLPDSDIQMVKSRSDYLYSDMTSNDNGESEYPKPTNYESGFLKQSEDVFMKGSKYKRKDKGKNLTITLDKRNRPSGEKMLASNSQKKDAVGEMIPAKKKNNTREGVLHMMISDRGRKK